MEELALHILDLAENCIAAGARHVQICVTENQRDDQLRIEVSDDGAGMNSEALQRSTDPFFTSRTTRRVGLGLPLFEQAAKRAGGEFRIESRPGGGTKVTGVFRHSHPDRQPLGDIGQTLLTLVVGSPQVEFTYRRRTDDSEVFFDTQDLRARLGNVPLSSPQGIAAVRFALAAITPAALSRP